MSSISSKSTTSTGSRISTKSNKALAIEDLKKTYARRNFLKSVLNEEDDLQDTLKMKYSSKYIGNTLSSIQKEINSSFDSYKNEASKTIPKKIESLKRNFSVTGRIGRISDPHRGIVSQYDLYPYLRPNEIKNVHNMVSKRIYNINPNYGIHSYNEGKLINSTINGIDEFLGFPQSHSNSSSISSISSGSSYGGKGKKRTSTKGKKRVTKSKKRTTKGKKRVTKK